jgi:hypothetical protein
MVLHHIVWGNGAKWIIWLTNVNARGRKFSGDARDTRRDREEALERLVQEMAANHIGFVGVNVPGVMGRGCERTLQEMKRIYRDSGGLDFQVEDLRNDGHPDRDTWDEVYTRYPAPPLL